MKNAVKTESSGTQSQNEGLELAKKVFELIDIFMLTLALVFVLVLWAFVYMVLFLLRALDYTGVLPVMYGVLIVSLVVGFLRLPDIIGGLRALRAWNKKYVAFAFLNVFEFVPRTKVNVAEEVVERIRMIYPAIDKDLKKHPDDVSYNDTIEGKKGRTYAFDAIIDNGDEFVLVEVKKGTNQAGLTEVKTFAEKLAQVVKDTDEDVYRAIMVSEGGFTEEAIDYVSSKENWIRNLGGGRVSPALLKVAENGYQVEWLQEMQQAQTS